MKYKAIFFDRDGTLTYYNPEKKKWRDEMIGSWSGKAFELPYEKNDGVVSSCRRKEEPLVQKC